MVVYEGEQRLCNWVECTCASKTTHWRRCISLFHYVVYVNQLYAARYVQVMYFWVQLTAKQAVLDAAALCFLDLCNRRSVPQIDHETAPLSYF